VRERISGSLSDWIQSTRALKPILERSPPKQDPGGFCSKLTPPGMVSAAGYLRSPQAIFGTMSRLNVTGWPHSQLAGKDDGE
jgi:hypothetical protein